jgi:hypothetical protein
MLDPNVRVVGRRTHMVGHPTRNAARPNASDPRVRFLHDVPFESLQLKQETVYEEHRVRPTRHDGKDLCPSRKEGANERVR